MNNTDDNLNLRSEEVQEILGRPPRSIVRWGITVVLLLVVGLAIGSYFIKYPDVLQASITVSSENLPADVVARASGKIDTLMVSERELVSTGDILAMLENPADLNDVLMLKTCPDSLFCRKSMHIGELQDAFTSYQKAKADYDYFVNADYHHKKIVSTKQQIAAQRSLLQKSRRQLSLAEAQCSAAQRLFQMDSMLYIQQALSLSDYQTARSGYLSQVQALESARMSIDNQQLAILQLEQSIFDLEQQCNDTKQQLSQALTVARDILFSQLDTWEQTYLLRAPCNGKVTLTKFWQKNQNVSAGDVVLTVVPDGSAHIVGKIELPPQGAGKVQVGQAVNIKFDNYPYMEFGMVRDTIRKIALVPIKSQEGSMYVLEVSLPERLVSTYGKELPFSQAMTGSAEIITADRRLIEQFLNPIKSILKR